MNKVMTDEEREVALDVARKTLKSIISVASAISSGGKVTVSGEEANEHVILSAVSDFLLSSMKNEKPSGSMRLLVWLLEKGLVLAENGEDMELTIPSTAVDDAEDDVNKLYDLAATAQACAALRLMVATLRSRSLIMS